MGNKLQVNFNNTFLLSNRLLKSIIPTFAIIGTIIVNGPPVFAATYYMATTGSDSNSGSLSQPFLTLKHSFQAMTAGDTLIIRNGTYTGTANQINESQKPPTSSSVWTTIKAENDGDAVFDGQSTNYMFSVTLSDINCHWKFEGLVWCRSSSSNVAISRCNYVKFLRCGAYDAGSGNTGNFLFLQGCNYILAEGCYAYGSGRSSISAWCSSETYQTSHIIFRNCVARIDRVSCSDPIYAFGMYSVDYGLIQNCIAIDIDQNAYYNNGGGDWAGGFAVPSTDHDANNVTISNSLVLNSHIGGLVTTANVYAAHDVTFNNCVVWDISNKGGTVNLNTLRGIRNVINHCTFGVGANTYCSLNGWGGSTTMKDSIITGYLGGTYGMYNISESYGRYYNNTNIFGDGASIGAGSKTTVNPIYNASTNPTGGLRYITRIETSSVLKGAGSTGDIGANLTNLLGTPGTLWGETGYNTDTGVSMWPFPNEGLIKTKMAAYSGGGVSGARGFCTGNSKDGTPQTLTKYIWEYLGYQIPTSIYGSHTISAPTGVTVQIIQ